MSQDEKSPYGKKAIRTNTDNRPEIHSEAIIKADQLRQMIRNTAYVLAERHAFVSGYELED